jgi:hypothetical protein
LLACAELGKAEFDDELELLEELLDDAAPD